jgi:hypothetical protein
MAMVKVIATSGRLQSPALLATTPCTFIRGGLKLLQAYTDPMQRCMAIDAGGTSQRLKPGGAMMRSLERRVNMKPAIVANRESPGATKKASRNLEA